MNDPIHPEPSIPDQPFSAPLNDQQLIEDGIRRLHNAFSLRSRINLRVAQRVKFMMRFWVIGMASVAVIFAAIIYILTWQMGHMLNVMDTMNREFGSMTHNMDSMRDRMDSMNSRVSHLPGIIGNVSTIGGSVETMHLDLGNIADRMRHIRDSVGHVNSSVASMQGNFVGMDHAVSGIRHDVNTLSSPIRAFNQMPFPMP